MCFMAEDSVCATELPCLELSDVCSRVKAEFREMPGLTLTSAQACRLFGLDRPECERVLGALVTAGFLATDGRVFARADRGRHVV